MLAAVSSAFETGHAELWDAQHEALPRESKVQRFLTVPCHVLHDARMCMLCSCDCRSRMESRHCT
jgi:hypothetical protein